VPAGGSTCVAARSAVTSAAEDWFWSFETDSYYDGPPLADPQAHPAEQSVPGPQERVPADWQSHLN
jgi:hypothetical protein